LSSRVIFGVDINRGSPRAKKPPRYTIAILENGEIRENNYQVTRHHLLRMVWKRQPEILAVDSIHELARDRRELLEFLGKLPPQVKVIQVTGELSLHRLASLHGIQLDRFNPYSEARACAILAGKGIGLKVLAFENKTKIKVSRSRSPGRGGWSQNRYRRKIHGAVREQAREIKEKLDELAKTKGITYTSNIVQGYGGYTRAEFTVYAPKKELTNIHTSRKGDVQVKIWEIEKNRLELQPLSRRYTIVGIDPGTTTAIAILSLEGELIWIHSSRTTSPDETVSLILKHGKPLLIASDVYPPPHTVEKIRRSFNAIPAAPQNILTIEEKIELTRPYRYSNSHERDALAAAIHAYRKYKNKFNQIRKKTPPHQDPEEAIANTLHGKTTETEKEEIQETTEKPQETKETPEPSNLQKRIHNQRQQINHLKSYLEELKTELKTKNQKIARLEKKITLVRGDLYREIRMEEEWKKKEKEIKRLKKTLQEKEKQINQLKKQISNLKEIRKMELRGNLTPVKVIPAFNRESIQKTQQELGIKPGDTLYLEDASGGGPITARLLAQLKPKAIITGTPLSDPAEEEFFKNDIPIIKKEEINLTQTTDFTTITPESLEKAIKQWEQKAKERKIKLEEEKLQSIIEEYRSERKKTL